MPGRSAPLARPGGHGKRRRKTLQISRASRRPVPALRSPTTPVNGEEKNRRKCCIYLLQSAHRPVPPALCQCTAMSGLQKRDASPIPAQPQAGLTGYDSTIPAHPQAMLTGYDSPDPGSRYPKPPVMCF